MSQQPKTNRDDLLEQAGDDVELKAFIKVISNNKIHEISDRVHHKFWKCDTVWEIYRQFVEEELERIRTEILRLNKDELEIGTNI